MEKIEKKIKLVDSTIRMYEKKIEDLQKHRGKLEEQLRKKSLETPLP